MLAREVQRTMSQLVKNSETDIAGGCGELTSSTQPDRDQQPLLAVKNITVSAGKAILFENLSCAVFPGELVALTGPSGSGKTTLLRSIAGLIDTPSGNVHFNGRTRDEFGWTAFRRKVVFVDQQPALIEAPVEDNLRLPFKYKSTGSAVFPIDKAHKLFDQFGLHRKLFTEKAGNLSVGQKQRVCLIRALLLDPAILLLDEPTSALDVSAVDEVEKLIKDIAQNGVSALIVTHDMAQAQRLCHRIVDLEQYLVE